MKRIKIKVRKGKILDKKEKTAARRELQKVIEGIVILLKKTRRRSKKARKSSKKKCGSWICSAEYLQEKNAERKGFPMYFFRSLPSDLKKRFLKFEWKEIEKDFENLEEKAFPGIKKMEFLAKYSRDGVEALIDHFLLGLGEEINEKILKMLKMVRGEIEREEEMRKFLSNLFVEDRKLLFKKIFFNLSLFSREHLVSLEKEILEMEEGELRNLISLREFVVSMMRIKFKKKKAKFPKIKVQLKAPRSIFPLYYRVFLGKSTFPERKIMLEKLSFEDLSSFEEVVIKPYKFLSPYSWIFEMEGKRKDSSSKRYLCVRFRWKESLRLVLTKFNYKRILTDYFEKELVPRKVDFLKEMKIRSGKIFFIRSRKPGRGVIMNFPSSYEGEKVKIKFKIKNGKLWISAFKGEKKIKEKIIEKV